MEIIRTGLELKKKLANRKGVQKLGFVPTMGAIHYGHLSLIEASKKENDATLCSIFVNPTQFNDRNDLEKYPRPLEQDISLLEKSKVDFLFLPSEKEMYPRPEAWHIDLGGLDLLLEGKSRPGHFQGVSQVVHKLFLLVEPNRAYFGQKDYQQLLVIRKMVSSFNMAVEICSCPIVREADGLAKSSRNIHLQGLEREQAALISKVLFQALDDSSIFSVAETRERALAFLRDGTQLHTDYFSIVNATTLQEVAHWTDCASIIALVAVNAGNTRLIDNQFLRPLNF